MMAYANLGARPEIYDVYREITCNFIKVCKDLQLLNVLELRDKKSSLKVLRVLLLFEGVLQKYSMTSLYVQVTFVKNNGFKVQTLSLKFERSIYNRGRVTL